MQILYSNDIMYIFVRCEREKMGEMSEGHYKPRKFQKKNYNKTKWVIVTLSKVKYPAPEKASKH